MSTQREIYWDTQIISPLSPFQSLIADDLALFRERYHQTLLSGIGVVDSVVLYLTRTHGKGLRPTLTLLCARLNGQPPSEDAIRAAVIVELLHEATLVHDDVVDEASERRGFPSLSAHFKNKVAVLFGDYMLANVLTETLGARDLRWLDVLSETSRRMAKGELVQAARAKRADMTETDYLEMIGNKTAALFNACCRLGGLTGGQDDGQVAALGRFGNHLGIAFQIRDDMLDLFGNGSFIGKPVGGDLKDKKLTLPLLGALDRADKRTGRRIRARVRRGVKRGEIGDIIDFVKENGGDRYAEDLMKAQAQAAVKELSAFPDTPVKACLIDLAQFAITRKR